MDTPTVSFNLTSSEYKNLISMLPSKKNAVDSDLFLDLVNKLIMDHSILLQEVINSCHIQLMWADKVEDEDDEEYRRKSVYS
jgi:hypothetical protein